MATIAIHNVKGEKVGTHELSDALFGVVIKPAVVQQVVVAQQANSRQVLAHAKDRSEVRGGGRKPWRQKGTGRARHGSSRSPIWRGGGITFGPTSDRNFSQKVNKKMKRLALAMTLTDKVAESHLVALDALELTQAKTKQLAQLFKGFKIQDKKTLQDVSVLLVLPEKNKNLVLAARNLSDVTTIAADSLNVVDVLTHDYIVAPVASLQKIEKVFTA